MTPRAPDAVSFTPLRPVELLILTALGTGELHGYAIRKAVLDRTTGRVSIEAGNLYRHLRSLGEDGLVVEAASRADDDERRIYYALTPLGRRVLAAELERLRSLVQYAEGQGIIARSRV
jgi:DNA-binding PadR family transcriptional regulator